MDKVKDVVAHAIRAALGPHYRDQQQPGKPDTGGKGIRLLSWRYELKWISATETELKVWESEISVPRRFIVEVKEVQ